MTRKPCDFRESSVKRGIRAARNAGMDIAAVRISKDGTIEIIAGGKPDFSGTPDFPGVPNEPNGKDEWAINDKD